MKLKDIQCKQAKATDKIQRMADGGGLYLEVTKTGSKLWRMKYRFGGKEKRLSFGKYPLIDLKTARTKRDEAKLLLSHGIDPAIAKREEKILKEVSSNNTFEFVAREWFINHANKVTPKTLENIKNRLERNLFSKIGKLPIELITAPILLEALKEVESRGVLDTVKRCRQASNQIFRFAIASGKAKYNPASDIAEALQTKQVEHHKSMPLELLPEFLDKIERNEARLYKQTILALKMMVLTFTRKKELSHAKWEEISFEDKLWVIPAERMKMKKEHIVPLSKQAIEILTELKEINDHWEYVFPSPVKMQKPMHEDTILRAIYKLGYKGIATIHGFRALAMTTIMEELDYRYEVPDLQLAHSKGDSVRQAYDRTQFMQERIKMMQEWADYIDGLRK